MRKLFWVLLISSLLFWGVVCAEARRVALLPVADTSLDYNGIDLDTTDTLRQLLTEAGLTLLDDTALRRFLAVNRMRSAASIDSFTARKLGLELNVDLVLLASICENGAPGKERFGLVVIAVETVNGEVVWSAQSSSSIFQETALFGVGVPPDGPELKIMTLVSLARKIASELPDLGVAAPTRASWLKLVEIQIEPKYMRGGSRVECRLKLQSLDKMPQRVELSSGNQRIELVPGKKMGEYSGSWQVPLEDGEYQVQLDLFADSESDPLMMRDCAQYTVINQAPQLSFALKQGLTVGQVTVFRDQLLISSRLRPNRPVAHWQVKVKRLDGTVVVNDQVEGELPRDLLWRGINNKRQRLPDGEYDLSLTIWDAAGNRAEVSRRVSLQSECQPVEAKAVRRGAKNFIRLSTPEDSADVLALSWKLRVFLPEGELVMEHSGTSLPVELELPQGIKVDFLLFSIDVRDQVGNTFSLADSRLQIPSSGLRVVRSKRWSDDF